MGLNRPAVGRVFAILASLTAISPWTDAMANDRKDGSSPAMRNDVDRMNRIFAEDAEREDRLDPLGTLYRGEQVDPEAFARLFTDALDRERLASARRSLAALQRVDRGALTERERISYDVFASRKREEVDWLQPEIRELTGVRPFNHFGGLHVEFPTVMAANGSLPYATEADYRRALQLDAAFAEVIDNAILRFREGIASGVVEPKLTIRAMIEQLDALLAQPVAASPFYSPVIEFPQPIPAEARAQLRQAYGETIAVRLYPAYRKLRAFLAEEYLPAAREGVGLSAMKGGAGLYRQMIEQSTTLRLDPKTVHLLGLAEVARIKREMEGVKHELGFSGSLDEFFEEVRTDPKFHPASREQLSDGFARISRAVGTQMPRFFFTTPRTPLEIVPFPAYREKFEPGGSYYQGSADSTRPGMFFYNTYDLPSRFLTGMTTLFLHEGMPGHHLQVSLAQEDESLPSFQRFEGNDAFVEGWALYAETLGYEMGLYDDPMQHWGTLDDEMLRAMRLVVDTGLHSDNWSRERAIGFMLDNSGMSRTDAEAEVDRYIANPAQALSYKIGALTIQELRHKAEAALGNRFDLRAFHDQVLNTGALPLPILQAKIESWIAASR